MGAVDSRKALSTTAFILIVSIVLTIAGLYMYNVIQWRNYPDFGFGFRTATGIEVVGTITENGRRAGLQLGDRIEEVNSGKFTSIQEFRQLMHRGLGEENTYLIERKGRVFAVTLKNIPIGFERSFVKSGFLYMMGMCYFLIGALVFLMKPHEQTTWIFFIFTTVSGLFMAFLYKIGEMTPFFLETVQIFFYTFTPAVFIHLACNFPKERSLVQKYPYTIIFPYLISAILFLRIRSLTPAMTDVPKFWLVILIIYLATGILLFLGSCLQLWLTSKSQIVKLRSKLILLGMAVSVSIPLIDLLSSALFNLYLIPGFNYYIPFFIVFPLSIGYSIVKHDLFDFDAIIKRTYGYVLTTGAIAGFYGLFVFISDMVFGRFEITKSPLFPLVFILAVVFLFNPIRNRAQKFIDRVFYRLEYDYQDTVHRISETMRSLMKLDEIGKSIMDIALGTLFVDAGGVMLLNKGQGMYEYLFSAGEREKRKNDVISERGLAFSKKTDNEKSHVNNETLVKTLEPEQAVIKNKNDGLLNLKLPQNDPLIRKIAEKKKEITIYDIQEDPFFEDQRTSCEDAFDCLQATLIVPLIYEDKLTGLISLGEKKSGRFYRREDINLLNTLANQGAVAIENARMIEEVIEKERMEEELSIARDLQTSMLPAECPTPEGFEIAAYSLSAREVGGDFYDFIEIGEDKVGIVIGDVTGKSVSGALVMSASRSVFRMLSEELLSVADIMIRANRRTKKDIKSGMFVALLYAVLDAKKRILSLCSAGQTQPVYWSSKTDTATLVETRGDTFPLGILEDADYEETRLNISPGDKIVLYTDGIVEAMNEKEEIFGFERLLEIVQAASSMETDRLLKEILDQVNAFVGGAAQHDDLTIIVISAIG